MLHKKQNTTQPSPNKYPLSPLIKGITPHPNPLLAGEGKSGFTLVELIVVVTILAILATIGFVSYSSYLTGVRDTNRIAQMTSLSDGLNLYSTTNDLPIPEDNVEVSVNNNLIAYQGYAGANILETINFEKGGVDPRDNTYFSYYLTRDRKYFQLMGFLEESADLTTHLIPNPSPLEEKGVTAASLSPKGEGIQGGGLLSSAQAVSLQDRIPTVTGKKLGILTDTSNTPIQELGGSVNITSSITEEYIAYFSGDNIFEGTGSELAAKIQLHVNSVPSFNPKSVPGLFMWFDAADTTTIEKNASNIISQWNDKSGKNNHFNMIEGDPSYGDYSINGQKTVYFDGDDSMNTTASFDAPYNIIYVAKMEGSQNNRALGGDGTTLFGFNAGTKNDVFLQGGFALNSPTLATTETELFSLSRDISKNTSFFNNGNQLTLTNETEGGVDFGKLWAGRTASTSTHSKVQMAEILVFDKVISEQQRLNIESYLNSKWGPF